ncbi:MAG: NTP transferase domain-containing protein [Lachnospiraceae bacterium]|nr:NTP transferase domain-containing protein [Lachnospiraceae bacterium]
MDNKFIVKNTKSVKDVVSYMDENSIRAVAVIGDDDKFEGLFTFGDMRKYFIRGGELNSSITKAMNPKPVVFKTPYDAEKYEKKLTVYPIVNEDGYLVDMVYDNNNLSQSEALNDVPLVIMAGGKGTRLYPYTRILPKALIPIGELTISERIINMFKKFGCRDFRMILNYKADMIKSYFEQLDKDYSISFEIEDKFLGTGGGLFFLKDKIKDTFFLSNCDILVDADLECIYKTHKMKHNKITVVCAMRDVTIPYGVVEVDDDARLLDIKEKPEYSFLTNTGLYVIEPEVVEELKNEEFIHMTDIAMKYVNQGERVGIFPISEKSWMDMGQIDEMEKMISLFPEV